jgi:hypothetical protein
MTSKLRGIQAMNTAMTSGQRSLPRTQDGMRNDLAQLKREEGRLTWERQAWQARIQRIDARLAEMAHREKSFRHAVTAEEDRALDAKAPETTGRKETANQMIIRY